MLTCDKCNKNFKIGTEKQRNVRMYCGVWLCEECQEKLREFIRKDQNITWKEVKLTVQQLIRYVERFMELDETFIFR